MSEVLLYWWTGGKREGRERGTYPAGGGRALALHKGKRLDRHRESAHGLLWPLTRESEREREREEERKRERMKERKKREKSETEKMPVSSYGLIE